MSADLDHAYAPVGGPVDRAGHGRSNDRLTSIKVRVGDVEVDTHDEPQRMALSAVQHLVWHALLEPQTFPIELRVDRTTVLIPVDGERREFTLYTLGERAAAVADGIEIYAPLDRVNGLELRSLSREELSSLAY